MVDVQAIDRDTIRVTCGSNGAQYDINREDRFRFEQATDTFDRTDVIQVTEMDTNGSDAFPGEYMLTLAQRGASMQFVQASTVGEWLCEGVLEPVERR